MRDKSQVRLCLTTPYFQHARTIVRHSLTYGCYISTAAARPPVAALWRKKMYLGRVMGAATSTVKHPSMKGWKLLLIMALKADGKTIEGDPVLAVDSLGAGKGQTVMITSDGIGAREMLGDKNSPVRWTVLGISDRE